MSESRPSSELPPPPTGGTGYIVLVVLLLAAIGGILYWKLKGPQTVAPVLSALPMQTTAPQFVEPPPPPPPIEDLEQADSGGAVKTATAPGSNPCNALTCSGSASAALQTAMSQRASSGRRCYERALRVNSALQGRMTFIVRVDGQGNVCSASVTQDEIHSNEVATCLLGAFRSGKFPPATGGCVDIKVPLSFVPQGK